MVSGGLLVVWLMLAIRGVILRLKKQGRLKGNFARDRRLILHALGGLGLTALLPTVPAKPRSHKLTNVRERVHQPFRDSLITGVYESVFAGHNTDLFARGIQ